MYKSNMIASNLLTDCTVLIQGDIVEVSLYIYYTLLPGGNTSVISKLFLNCVVNNNYYQI